MAQVSVLGMPNPEKDTCKKSARAAGRRPQAEDRPTGAPRRACTEPGRAFQRRPTSRLQDRRKSNQRQGRQRKPKQPVELRRARRRPTERAHALTRRRKPPHTNADRRVAAKDRKPKSRRGRSHTLKTRGHAGGHAVYGQKGAIAPHRAVFEVTRSTLMSSGANVGVALVGRGAAGVVSV